MILRQKDVLASETRQGLELNRFRATKEIVKNLDDREKRELGET